MNAIHASRSQFWSWAEKNSAHDLRFGSPLESFNISKNTIFNWPNVLNSYFSLNYQFPLVIHFHSRLWSGSRSAQESPKPYKTLLKLVNALFLLLNYLFSIKKGTGKYLWKKLDWLKKKSDSCHYSKQSTGLKIKFDSFLIYLIIILILSKKKIKKSLVT